MMNRTNTLSHDNPTNSGASPVIGLILMVGIFVVLSTFIGAFVLGYTDSLNNKEMPEIEVVQYSDHTTVTIIDTGDFDDARIVSPSTNTKSMRLGSYFTSSTKIIIHNDPLEDADNINISNRTLPTYVEDASGGYNLTQDDTCMLRTKFDPQKKETKYLKGIFVNQTDVGCSGKYLEKAAKNIGTGKRGYTSDFVPHEPGTVYLLELDGGPRAKLFEVRDIKGVEDD